VRHDAERVANICRASPPCGAHPGRRIREFRTNSDRIFSRKTGVHGSDKRRHQRLRFRRNASRDCRHPAKAGFFVGGAAKSGTTWLQFLLNAHPEISCTGEGHFANKLMPGLAKTLQSHNATLSGKSSSIFDGLNQQPLLTNRHALYLATAAICLLLDLPDKLDPARIVGDKTPDNVRDFSLLATMFPQAKFIHIVRDARDCAVSAFFHNQRVSP
jgi:hypothetical protein